LTDPYHFTAPEFLISNRILPSIALLSICLSLVLSGCNNYASERSRQSTQIYFKDSSVVIGELLGVNRDSLIYRTRDRAFNSVHFASLDRVVLSDDGSHIAGRLFSTLLFGFAGMIAGGVIGSSIGRNSGGEWAGLTEGFAGALLGLILGGGTGAALVTRTEKDREIRISSQADLSRLAYYSRYTKEYELRVARGY
jgi:hypothetical protein